MGLKNIDFVSFPMFFKCEPINFTPHRYDTNVRLRFSTASKNNTLYGPPFIKLEMSF